MYTVNMRCERNGVDDFILNIPIIPIVTGEMEAFSVQQGVAIE
jgi:hypothetical protein